MRVIVLGSGTSTGVPYIGCGCKVCNSSDPRDHRLRCCSLVETDDGRHLLLDCGPDFRQQMLRLYDKGVFPKRSYDADGLQPPHDESLIDGVFLTHCHYDHVGGLDDLRPGIFGDITVYAEESVMRHLEARIPYCFKSYYKGTPQLNEHVLEIEDSPEGYEHPERNAVTIGDNTIVPLRVYHAIKYQYPILGYHIGSMAYITDMRTYPAGTRHYLEQAHLDTLFVNCLRYSEHPTHQNFEQAIAFARNVRARHTYFIHMCHEIGLHTEAEARLQERLRELNDPLDIHFAYDGEEITIDNGHNQ